MDHQTALSSQAVERYTLGEFTSPQREEFEEHFFSCPDCASALKEYEVFVANTRAVFKEDAAPSKQTAVTAAQPGWWKGVKTWFGAPVWVPAFAALAVAFVLLRNPGQPSLGPASGKYAEVQLTADFRGPVQRLTVPPDVAWVTLGLELQGMDPKRWASYRWELSDSNDTVVNQGVDTKNPWKHDIAASKFDSGKTYVLTMWGDRAVDPTPLRSRFAIDRK